MTLGELTVFLTYLPRLTDYMAFVGDIIAQHRRTGVAYERIRPSRSTLDLELLDRTPVSLMGPIPEVEPPCGRTEPFEARGDRAHPPVSGRGGGHG